MTATPSGTGPRPLTGSRRTGRAALAGAVCAALAAALAGCAGEDPDAGTNGVGKLPAATIEAKARAAAEQAGTVRLSGKVVSQDRTYQLDMRLAKDGARGELTTKDSAFQLLRIGTALYLKADVGFWAGEKSEKATPPGGTAAAKLGGKYVKVPATDPVYKRFSGFTDKKMLLASLLGPHGTPATGDRGTLDGVRTIRLTGGAGGNSLDVSLEGEPYPLRLRRAGGAGEVRLGDWGKPVDLQPPDRDQIVDYGKQIAGSG
ncbi:hypothetical protein [Streptomyces celluloflavus]|uniref:hypothetical protein n=1 Tax=Streptomyces celluloflavus TaxID=58344 RepID=UPI0036B932A1